MAHIPGGQYRPQKRTRTRISVEAFCIDVTEVTVADYKACVRESKCSPECLLMGTCSAVPTQASWSDPQESLRASKYCNGDRDDRQDHPANCVSLEESATYCEAYGKRLPSSAEWEWSALGARERAFYPWGMADVQKTAFCWSTPDALSSTCRAGGHPADRTPQGVFDLAGNVSEWVAGQLTTSGAQTPTRQAFGASWYSMDDGYVRAALGGIEMPSARNETVGFRCAKNTEASPDRRP